MKLIVLCSILVRELHHEILNIKTTEGKINKFINLSMFFNKNLLGILAKTEDLDNIEFEGFLQFDFLLEKYQFIKRA